MHIEVAWCVLPTPGLSLAALALSPYLSLHTLYHRADVFRTNDSNLARFMPLVLFNDESRLSSAVSQAQPQPLSTPPPIDGPIVTQYRCTVKGSGPSVRFPSLFSPIFTIQGQPHRRGRPRQQPYEPPRAPSPSERRAPPPLVPLAPARPRRASTSLDATVLRDPAANNFAQGIVEVVLSHRCCHGLDDEL